MSYDLFVFAGETSGDIHGAAIISQLKQMRPEIQIIGVAGPKMRKLGLELFMPMENFQIMGYSEVFKNIFRLAYYFKKIQNFILSTKPKAVLFIDYPGFNLRMAKALRRRQFSNKLIHYICPTVWAHGKKRIYTLSNTLDLLLSIFPFEEEYFSKTKLKPTYVGHPLIEQTFNHVKKESWKKVHSIQEDRPLIGVFPGSRSQEIKLNFPKILEACKLFQKNYPDVLFVVSTVNQKLKQLMVEILKKTSFGDANDFFLLPSTENLQIMSHVQAAVATSGTINFELAIMNVPTAVVYHLSHLNAWIVKNIIKLRLPFYCIVNIITKKHIFPELYHLDFTPEKVAKTLSSLYNETHLRKNSLDGCKEMLSIMGSSKIPSQEAAREISSTIYAQ
ncbi:MAG: Lipid-A-disaccharide synthase [Chlamydiae bacterium]|nr:Lipid-A-disaccharide synthase [Chlamydiota bacterium]